MISFVMPAKNVAPYVNEAVGAVLSAKYPDWELIVVDDHSADGTLDILRGWEKRDGRIRVHQNKGAGKILGLNYGYSLARGDVVKCIDADDVLAHSFFDHLGDLAECDASCHGYFIANSALDVVGRYFPNKTFFNQTFEYCLRNLVSLPRCVWTFTRCIGDNIFPMPENLPFEDVWFALIIKKYAGSNIKRIDKPLYYYRQHSGQAYGGILNFSQETLAFRGERMLNLIETIEHEPSGRLVCGERKQDIFDNIRTFYRLLAEKKPPLSHIIFSRITAKLKLKLLVYKKLGFLAPAAVRLKWFLDGVR
jgi:glycosyltransferase involved in cell wall biosynthesis